LDLFRFLAELGKPGAYDASKGGVARVWKLLPGTHRIEQFGVDKIVSGETSASDWTPINSLVDGRLMKEDVQEATVVGKNLGLVSVFASAQFQSAKAGAVTLTLEGPDKASVWIDGKPASGGGDIKADVTAGKHTIIVRIDAREIPGQLRLKSNDVTFLVN